jgi:signal transduction histidine kinase
MERRVVVLAAVVALFLTVFVLRATSAAADQTVAVLYTVPIALVALELGAFWGVVAALVAIALLGASAAINETQLGVGGFSTHAVAFLAVGAVAGRFGDRMRDAQDRQHRLLWSGLKLAHLESELDLRGTAAKQAASLMPDRPVRIVLPACTAADVPADHPDGDQVPIEVRGVHYGSLVVGGSRPLNEDDHATLSMLALQTAVAAENLRLLEGERERARMQAQLEAAHVHLGELGEQLREVLARQEAERGQLAHELHEEAAQTLAAVLLGLGALERELGANISGPRLGELRSEVDATLRSLRSLAISLRPSELTLGLRAALEQLAHNAAGFDEIAIDVGELEDVRPDRPEVGTMLYRAVEESLYATRPARSVSVQACERTGELVIEVAGTRRAIAGDRLAVLKARLELTGGTVATTAHGLRAVIPLRFAQRSPSS